MINDLAEEAPLSTVSPGRYVAEAWLTDDEPKKEKEQMLFLKKHAVFIIMRACIYIEELSLKLKVSSNQGSVPS